MKSLILNLMVLLSFTPFASACEGGANSCGINADAFNNVLNYRCSRGSIVSAEGATTVARKVAAGEMDVSTFKNVFYSTCDFEKAVEIAEGDKEHTISFAAFADTVYYRCSRGSIVSVDGATTVGKKVAARSMEVSTFKNVFYSTCDFEKAVEIAEGDKERTISFAAFADTVYYRCSRGRIVSADGATTVGQKVAAGKMDLRTFKKVFYNTCDFLKAVEISCL